MFLWKLFLTLILIYSTLLVVIFLAQRKLLYEPTQNNYLEENLLSHKVEKIKIPSNDNINLISWYFLKNKNFKTLVFFHGNAGGLENRIYKLNHLSDLNLNYLIFAYRGFSGNNGKPTEEGIYRDSKAVINWLNSKGIKKKDIILYGESLGGAVAIEIAQKENFAGIILESTFTSMIDMGQKYYPIFPVSFLLKDKYETKNKIKNLNSPTLVMHGKKDKIVPFYMGEKIYDLLNTPKYKYFTNNDDHMMEFNDQLVINIKKFIETL